MKQIVYIIVVFYCLVIAQAYKKFKPSQTIKSMPINPKQMEYSPQMNYLAISTINQLYLYQAVTVKKIRQKNYSLNLNYSTFAFSQDDSLLAVGFDSQICTYGLYHITDEGIDQEILQVGNNLGSINSLCFNADNSHLILGTSKGFIVVIQRAKNKKQVKRFRDQGQDNPVSVSCNPIRSLQFSAVQLGQIDINSINISVYNLNISSGLIQQIKQIPINPQYNIQSFTYSSSGLNLWILRSEEVGNSIMTTPISINMQNLSLTLTNIYINGNTASNLKVSTDQDYISVYSNNEILVNFYVKPQTWQEQIFNSSSSPTYSLSPSGGTITFYTNSTQIAVASQCDSYTFLDPLTGNCTNCSQQCELCFNNPTPCLKCHQGFYVGQDVCLTCTNGCKQCNNNKTCIQCFDTFQNHSDLKCYCQKGYYSQENNINISTSCAKCPSSCSQCQSLSKCTACAGNYALVGSQCQESSIPAWVIVLIVIAGIALAAFVILLIKRVKQRRQKKYVPLTQALKQEMLTDKQEGSANPTDNN